MYTLNNLVSVSGGRPNENLESMEYLLWKKKIKEEEEEEKKKKKKIELQKCLCVILYTNECK